jgi:hypothetical protein
MQKEVKLVLTVIYFPCKIESICAHDDAYNWNNTGIEFKARVGAAVVR